MAWRYGTSHLATPCEAPSEANLEPLEGMLLPARQGPICETIVAVTCTPSR